MKLLIDMNLSPRWVEHLQTLGIASVHWSTMGAGNATDAEIMAVASAHGYVVLTHDLDFGAMLATTLPASPSVVQLRAADIDPDVAAVPLATIIQERTAELEAGAILSVDLERARVRLLPLK